jgi:Cu(I)/Ag(I) efflux system membrane fusion protein
MNIFAKRNIPWLLVVVFATAFILSLLSRRSAAPSATPDLVVQDNSGRRVIAWIDPMYSQGPPHLYKSNKPGIAPDCGMKLVPQYADETAAGKSKSSVSGYSPLSLPSASQQLIGVKLAKAELRPLTISKRTVGRVTADERKLAQIHSKVDGYVEQLFVSFTGQSVRRGEALLTLYSPDLLSTQQELLLAQRNSTPVGRTLAASARRRLLLWDVSAAEIDRVVRTGTPLRAMTLRSPVNGVVMTRNVAAGARVMPADTLYELADLSSVWVIADLYESDLSRVVTGSTVQITIESVPRRIWGGRVDFISPTINPATRTATVRIQLDNKDGALKPDMYANVLLDQVSGPVVAVPDRAVMQTGTRSIAFVARGDGEFDPRQVETGTRAGGWIEIRRGIAAGDTVVADANFLVDSESRLKSAISGVKHHD